MPATTSDAALGLAEAGLLSEPVLPAPVNHDDYSIPWLTLLGFAFLTFNSGMAIYRSNGDLAATSFVAFSYLDLIFIFYCLGVYKKGAPNNSPHRVKVKAAVWILTTLLTLAFSYKVVTVMSPLMAAITLAMTAASLFGGFYGFFTPRERQPQTI